MKRVYAFLLRLYPRDQRTLFATEMLATFEEAAAERRGWLESVRFVLAELTGLVLGVGTAWMAHRWADPALDLTKMRPVGVTQEAYGAALDEVIEAQRLVAFNLRRMEHAIYHHQFVMARFYSDEDRKARENLRLVRKKYRIAE